MDPFAHEVAERRIDHPLAFDTVLAGKCRTFDAQAEVALPRRIVAAVAAVLLAVIGEFDRCRRKSRIEPAKHFSRDRTGFLGVHWLYIEEFDGDEAIQDAWAG